MFSRDNACGTVMPNRKYFPADLRSTDKRKPESGFSTFQADDNLAAVVWMDKKPIHLLSTCYDPTEIVHVKRKQHDGTIIQLPCPVVVQKYNDNMGGCDLNDHMTKLNKSRKHYNISILKLNIGDKVHLV